MKLTEQQILDVLHKHSFRMSDIFNDGLVVITDDEFHKIADEIIEANKLDDTELDQIKDDYEKQWKDRNRSYPGERDYLSGINDGIYHLRNKIQNTE